MKTTQFTKEQLAKMIAEKLKNKFQEEVNLGINVTTRGRVKIEKFEGSILNNTKELQFWKTKNAKWNMSDDYQEFAELSQVSKRVLVEMLNSLNNQ